MEEQKLKQEILHDTIAVIKSIILKVLGSGIIIYGLFTILPYFISLLQADRMNFWYLLIIIFIILGFVVIIIYDLIVLIIPVIKYMYNAWYKSQNLIIDGIIALILLLTSISGIYYGCMFEEDSVKMLLSIFVGVLSFFGLMEFIYLVISKNNDEYD